MEDDATNADAGLVDNGDLGAEDTSGSAQEENDNSEENDNFAKQFAALSRKEKAHRDSVRQWEDDKVSMEERLQKYQDAENAQKQPEALPLEHRLKRDPLGTLAELGYGLDELTELALNDGNLSQDMKMKVMREDIESASQKRIEELEARLNSRDKQEEESKYANVVENFKTEINDHVTSNPESFELISSTDSQDLVYQVIEQHYQETEEILTVADAATAVENHLSEQAERIFKIKKYENRFKQEPLEPRNPERQSPTTLSNEQSTNSSTVVDQMLSDQESKAQAAKLISWD